MNICVWPDGGWCHESELEEMTHRSDDYLTMDVSEDYDDEAIEEYVAEYTRIFG